MTPPRTIRTCAGIGDNIWVLQKLINTGERFNFELPDGTPRRGAQIFELLPQICDTVSYVPGLSYNTLARFTETGKWRNIIKHTFYLECNKWLESGRMLKDWLPDLPTSYKLPWKVPVAPVNTGNIIGIYGSAYSTQRAWKQFGAWGCDEWMKLIKLIHSLDKGYKFVVIGAEWDNDFATELTRRMTEQKIPFVNTVGSKLEAVMNWMQSFHYAFYFPSGLPILSESLEGGSDCLMFYTHNIAKIIGTWCDPERRADGRFKECLFCRPEDIYEWCIENGKI